MTPSAPRSTPEGASSASQVPRLGAEARFDSTHFALEAAARSCAVRLFGETTRTIPLEPKTNGLFEAEVAGVRHGARYTFVLDGMEARDPYARFLPEGVDRPAMVWRSSHAWRHAHVTRPLAEQVLYELHVGAFTSEGTYAGAVSKLSALKDLGVTTIELMPLGTFPGRRGWGYDVVAHFAPHAPYGNPDELRAFIDHAHGLGLAVLLDVVYNHFGAAGNVLPAYGDDYFSASEQTPWGSAPNLAHPPMRRYFVENARYWLEEFRFDGLRFDAVHAIRDRSPRHLLDEIAAATEPGRLLIAEDERNEPDVIRRLGCHAVWADDFHHQVRVALTGEQDGYYAAYSGKASDVAKTIEGGWFYQGDIYPPTGAARGRSAGELTAEAFVYCIENHDQVGNRAFGDRLTESVSFEAFSSAAMLLLFLPMTPLLFMGQEWAASTPFLFFSDLPAELGPKVTEGRRREFARFSAFREEGARARIPDPQSATTFERSKLRWSERERDEHAGILDLHRRMLRLRASDPVLKVPSRATLRAFTDGDLLVVERCLGRDVRRLVVNFGASRSTPLIDAAGEPTVLLATEHARPMMTKGSALLVAYQRGE